MLISELGEPVLIEKIKSLFKINDGNVAVSIGDDAAVFGCDNRRITVTTDLMTEGIHFDYSYTTFYQVGFKLITSNVSDVYSMGGRPAYAFLNIAMSDKRSEDEFDEFLQGVHHACNLYDIGVLGGDLSSSIKGDFYSATLTGFLDRAILRSGAKKGDGVFITGGTGDAAAGLAYLKKIKRKIALEKGERIDFNQEEKPILEAIRKHLLPVARNPLQYIGRANSMIDISDGLLLDVYRVCTQSRKGVVLYKENIPVSEGTKAVASLLGGDLFEFVLSGGEDYELLITSREQTLDNCIRIGEITDEGFYIIDSKGEKTAFSPKGYVHFS